MSIESVIPAFDSRQQPVALYDAIRDILQMAPGFKLFTILSCEHEKQLVQRIYTSHPDEYPIGGTKKMLKAPWSPQVMEVGKTHIGLTKEEIRDAFFDYELIWALGGECFMIVPIRWRGRTIGSLNLFHSAGRYGQSEALKARLMAQMAIPAVQLSIAEMA
jgi:hypothetical protein